ncbi:hypothetical protein CCY99_03800 [Helicobacter sp. 16-1353]|uniref:MlaE family ABC transporter permease n=1 Tax=Helicobacter sp. 16-1353 TaxID=2004996 RepID=UPI000DCEF756|nr:ABC transporter permease [Helicobacter sp. 16-1353]RAX54482.1 hypothetical protein CCY99_03800 [Helicobacter sp. 16-1353]
MISYEIQNKTLTIILKGHFDNRIKKDEIDRFYKILDSKDINTYLINLNEISKFDISFLVFLSNYADEIKYQNKNINFIANNDNAKKILELLENITISKQSKPAEKKLNPLLAMISKTGFMVVDSINVAVDFINFIGMVIYSLLTSLFRPRTIRYKAISYHIYHGVITAMPIICMVSFIVGGVIAYQGGVTLQRMGFSQATVEMTAKLTLREIGPFVVALIVAGRSASSYTAQIGVMKMTEEINAMKTMDFNLLNFIVLPRFLALVLSFPLMVFVSDLISIFGCMVFLKAGFDITFPDYITQLKDFVDMNSFWTGMIKAPFYAATIAIIGCFVGFRVEDNTQSVGEKTTTSVVYALFGVILVNAVFSLIFTELKF